MDAEWERREEQKRARKERKFEEGLREYVPLISVCLFIVTGAYAVCTNDIFVWGAG